MFKALRQLSNSVKHLFFHTKNNGMSDIKMATTPRVTAIVCDFGNNKEQKKYKKHAASWPYKHALAIFFNISMPDRSADGVLSGFRLDGITS